jgi:hypothetical protein
MMWWAFAVSGAETDPQSYGTGLASFNWIKKIAAFGGFRRTRRFAARVAPHGTSVNAGLSRKNGFTAHRATSTQRLARCVR